MSNFRFRIPFAQVNAFVVMLKIETSTERNSKDRLQTGYHAKAMIHIQHANVKMCSIA
jgi:hypothetical protein